MRYLVLPFVTPICAAITIGCGGGNSGTPSFAPPSSPTPCAAPQTAGPASTQTKARLGIYYFDGWSGALSTYHFNGLLSGPYQGRQPVTGWQDNSSCAVELQLAWAHKFGIDFFVFDWFYNAIAPNPGENLNNALQITRALPNRHGMQYAILYVDGPPFVVPPASWSSAVDEWTSYMVDPAYVRVNGKPVLFIINMGPMRDAFGSSSAVAAALNQLRAAAQAKGLPGVFVVGGFGVPEDTSGQDSLFPDLSWVLGDGYDAFSMYNYPYTPMIVNGMLPFSSLSDAGRWTWTQCAAKCHVPFIPVAMDGWDPRPWNERAPNGDLVWYNRTPSDVTTFVSDAIAWANANPQVRPEPPPTPPLVLMEAWNELGEGSYLVPTVGDGSSFGDSLATMLSASGAKTRSGPAASGR